MTELIAWRAGVAGNRPLYTIMDNLTLEHIAADLPSNEEEFLAIPGLGPYRWQHYGKDILRLASMAKDTDELDDSDD